jgi:4-hydroxythreonine-4-phosphate dehydrogenase
MDHRPRLLITLGDVAGIGPEIVAKAWTELNAICRPAVVGDPEWLRRGLELAGRRAEVYPINDPTQAESAPDRIPCLQATSQNLRQVEPGRVSAAAGRAAYDFLCAAIDWTLAGKADGIVTAPLHKEGLHAAGLSYPGHTEILAERTGVREFAMVLAVARPNPATPWLAVAHVTLHVALRDTFGLLTPAGVLEKTRLLDGLLFKLIGRRPRLGVAALNPHASDGGLFGDEEVRLIAPAVEAARKEGLNASGPWPTDTLFVRARAGEFDGVVAMYHDQGHIALKLMGEGRAVNVSVGLPIVRTSVAHGTAYDIVGRGVADERSLIQAARVAASLAAFAKRDKTNSGCRSNPPPSSHPLS